MMHPSLIVLLLLNCPPQFGGMINGFVIHKPKSYTSSTIPNPHTYQRTLQKHILNKRSNALFVTSSPPTSSPPKSSYNVIFQKVIRPSFTELNENSSVLFLSTLVEYIQSHFEIPDGLPMVYEKVQRSDNVDTVDEDSSQHFILSIDSPLSSDNQNRMDIEVVAICPEGNENMLPSMAMVVVKKRKQSVSSSDGSIMMQNLFQKSEQKIMKSLDCGLDDFISGRIQVKLPEIDTNEDTSESTTPPTFKDVETDEDIIGQSKLEKETENIHNDRSDHGLDSVDDKFNTNIGNSNSKSTLSKGTDLKIQDAEVEKEILTENIEAQKVHDKRIDTSNDYAVKMASLKAAELLKEKVSEKSGNNENPNDVPITNEKSNVGDFAVSAARAKADAIRKKGNDDDKILEPTAIVETEKMKREMNSSQKEVDIGGGTPTLEHETIHPSKNMSAGKASTFRVSISNPKQFKSRQSKKNTSIDQSSKPNRSEVSSMDSTKHNLDDKEILQNNKVEVESLAGGIEETVTKAITEPSADSTTVTKEEINKVDSTKTVDIGEESDQDLLNNALNIMSGSDDNNETNLTPEELLKDILKFGDEYEQKEADGNSFASGALGKAKELIDEEQQKTKQVDNRNNFELAYKETASTSKKEPLSKEEELKRIFEAGEKIADNRIVTSSLEDSTYPGSKINPVTDEEIDDLINADNTVSRNAISLDDQLTELEVRISKSSEQISNDFDVLSGPEIYNPNVDPETSVNWPGAKRGTRNDVRLPTELAEAVKNAEFATKVLLEMTEKESDIDDSNRYFFGEKELSKNQVLNLRQCAEDGFEIGLVKNPVDFLAERSLLKFLLQELKNQPEDRFNDISINYKALLLSDDFALLVKERLANMSESIQKSKKEGVDTITMIKEHDIERLNLGRLVTYAQVLLKEVRAIGAELEAGQLEVIRSICLVAMDPKHTTEEETAIALTDAIRDMRPLLDESFVAYLKYAILEEQAKLARAGVLDDPEHNRWLFVLKIVQGEQPNYIYFLFKNNVSTLHSHPKKFCCFRGSLC